MNISTTNIFGRWAINFNAMLFVALMVPAVVFSQPTLVSPLNAALNVSTGPTLSWSTVPAAVTYHLQVSTDQLFGSTVYDNDISAPTVSQVITPVLANGTTYYWHVSDNVNGIGNYSAFQSFTTNPTPVDLGTAGNFRILANTGITGGAGSTITGDIGCLAAATTITGFTLVLDGGGTFATSTSVVGGGKVYAFTYAEPTPTNLTAAQGDMGTAYTNAAGRTPVPVGTFLNAGSGEIGGLDLGPGLYKWTSAVTISNDLTLTGNSTDVWIFQLASTLGMADGKQITLVGGALASNIFWQVAGQVTLIGTSAMKGIIMGQTGIAMGANGTLDGRALAQTNVTLITNGVFPVELVSFTGTANRTNTDLRWSTATELNNYGFEIQRKAIDNWNKVGFVDGNGTTNTPKTYSYTDNDLSSGKYSYRLKQIDRDGKFTYSQSIEVTIGEVPKEFALAQNYPNPFNPSTVISYQLPANSAVSLKVFDAIGREIATLVNEVKEAGSYSVQFNASHLSNGIYFYTIKAGNFTATKKLTLLK